MILVQGLIILSVLSQSWKRHQKGSGLVHIVWVDFFRPKIHLQLPIWICAIVSVKVEESDFLAGVAIISMSRYIFWVLVLKRVSKWESIQVEVCNSCHSTYIFQPVVLIANLNSSHSSVGPKELICLIFVSSPHNIRWVEQIYYFILFCNSH